jgi:hypothetical protein
MARNTIFYTEMVSHWMKPSASGGRHRTLSESDPPDAHPVLLLHASNPTSNLFSFPLASRMLCKQGFVTLCAQKIFLPDSSVVEAKSR